MRKIAFGPASFLTSGVALGLLLGGVAGLGDALTGRSARAASGDALVVAGDGVNVRFGPTLNAGVKSRAYRFQLVTELQREGDWVRVEIADGGQEGWIHGSLLAQPNGGRLAEPLVPGPAQPVAETRVPTVEGAAPAASAQPPAMPTPAPTVVEAAPAKPAVPTSPPATTAPPVTTAAAPAPAPSPAAPDEPAVTAPSPEPPVLLPAVTAPAATPAVAARQVPEAATIEPAAAPARDRDTADLARFRESVDYLNSRAVSVAGVDLFTTVEAVGGGVVQVAATEAWSTIPPAGQQSYANTLLDRWAAGRGYGGPVSVQIVDPNGQVLLESRKP